MVGIKVFADIGVYTGEALAGLLNLWRLAVQFVHIGGRAAKIRNRSSKTRHLIPYFFDLSKDAVFRPALDDPALMLRN